ncbi:MAG: hypothetical protein RIR17_1782 [Planctomycetota bacterium]
MLERKYSSARAWNHPPVAISNHGSRNTSWRNKALTMIYRQAKGT